MLYNNNDYDMNPDSLPYDNTEMNQETENDCQNSEETELISVQDDECENDYLPEDEDGNPIYTSEWLKQYTSLSGWLGFFLFAVGLGGILSAFMNFAAIKSENYLGSTFLALTDVIPGVSLLCIAIYTIYAFQKRKPNAVFWAKFYIILVFVTNLVALLFGEFDKTGFNTQPRAIQGFIYSIIWFIYLCVSKQVQEVIPPSFRKTTRYDWIIAALIVILPFICFGVGLSQLKSLNSNNSGIELENRESAALADYNKPQYIIDESILEDGEISNGQIIFKRPEKSYMEKRPLDPNLPNGDYGYYFANNKQANGYELYVMSSIVDVMPTEADIDELSNNWQPDWAKQWKRSVVKNETSDIKDGRIFEREYKYTHSGTPSIESRFVVIYNEQVSKACVIVAYEATGHTAPLEAVKNSIKFYNKIN